MSKGVCEERNLLHPLRKTSISCKDLINGTCTSSIFIHGAKFELPTLLLKSQTYFLVGHQTREPCSLKGSNPMLYYSISTYLVSSSLLPSNICRSELSASLSKEQIHCWKLILLLAALSVHQCQWLILLFQPGASQPSLFLLLLYRAEPTDPMWPFPVTPILEKGSKTSNKEEYMENERKPEARKRNRSHSRTGTECLSCEAIALTQDLITFKTLKTGTIRTP